MSGFSVPVVPIFGIDIVSFMVSMGIFFGVYLVITLSLNIEMGYTGIPNFGKLLAVAAGSAVASSLSGRLAAYLLGVNTHGDYIVFNTTIMSGVNSILGGSAVLSFLIFIFSLLVGAGVGALFGYISSYPAIKLREDYLAMLLLAAAQFFSLFLAAYPPLIGGSQPVSAPDPFRWAGTGRGVRDLVALVAVLAVAGLVYIYSERMARSPLGRTLRAVRDNETASEAVGKDNVAIRTKILVIASALSGTAGALWGMYLAANDATIWVRFDWTIVPWVMLILGGAGNNFGAAVGTFAFSLIVRVIGQAKLIFGDIPLPVGITNNGGLALQYMPVDVNRFEFLAVGVALVVVLLVRPQGIVAEKPTPTLSPEQLSGLLGPRAFVGTDTGPPRHDGNQGDEGTPPGKGEDHSLAGRVRRLVMKLTSQPDRG